MTDHLEPYRRMARSIRFFPPSALALKPILPPVAAESVVNSWAKTPSNADVKSIEPPIDLSEHAAALVHEAVCKPTVLPATYAIPENIGDRISRLVAASSDDLAKLTPKLPESAPNGTTAHNGDFASNSDRLVYDPLRQAYALESTIVAETVAEEPIIAESVAEEPIEVKAPEVPESVVEEPIAAETTEVPETIVEEPIAEVETVVEEPIAEVETVVEEPIAETTESVAEEPIAETTETVVEEPIAAETKEVPESVEEPIAETTEPVAEEPIAAETTEPVVEEPIAETTEPVAEVESEDPPNLLEKVSAVIEAVSDAFTNPELVGKENEVEVEPAASNPEAIATPVQDKQELLTTEATEAEVEPASEPSLLERVSAVVEVITTTLKKPEETDSTPATPQTTPDKPIAATCPACGSTDLRKNGRRQGKQRYACKDCGRQFAIAEEQPQAPTPTVAKEQPQKPDTTVEAASNKPQTEADAANSPKSGGKKKKAKGFGASKKNR